MKIEKDTVLLNEASLTLTVPVAVELDDPLDETHVEDTEITITVRGFLGPRELVNAVAVAADAAVRASIPGVSNESARLARQLGLEK